MLSRAAPTSPVAGRGARVAEEGGWGRALRENWWLLVIALAAVADGGYFNVQIDLPLRPSFTPQLPLCRDRNAPPGGRELRGLG